MLCPDCKNTFDHGNNCPHCHLDLVLYGRVLHLSEKLYNQGLERLHASDLTHGIEALTRAVAIDKNNVTARNLLGLALFEVGYIGEALKHWVISSSIQETDNPAESYLEVSNKSSRALEKLNDAIVMYNQALSHIKQKSDDLAIIQLKKAIENNPRFVDALNLLALCYLIQNDKERAMGAVERALSVDAQNPVSLGYFNLINPKGKVTRQPIQTKRMSRAVEVTSPYRTVGIQDKKHSNFHIAEILAFVIGGVSVFAIGYFLLFPNFEQQHADEIAALNQAAAVVEATHNEEIVSIQGEMDDLEATITAQDIRISQLETAAELQDRVKQVHFAYWQYQNGQLHEAIHILDNLNTSGMSLDIRNRIELIREGSYPQLATFYVNEGREAFNANDFYKALVDLEMAARFIGDEMNNQRRDFMYMLGTIYYNEGRMEKALELLLVLQENFSQHRRQAVLGMINRIEAQL